MSVVIKNTVELPTWAQVTEERLGHIHRVSMLLSAWAAAMRLSADQTRMFLDAGRLHDALRDAPEDELREITQDYESPVATLHGPAAAIMLERDGEQRRELLEAVRYHTVGYSGWDQVGRALYMADFLEPGRKYATRDRTFLSTSVPHAFDHVFRQIVKLRLEWAVREGKLIFPETFQLWNSLV